MTRILVTGATGTNGRQIAARLLQGGFEVRAGVRRPDQASDLKARGAELVEFDYDRPETVTAAFQGVERAFLLTPFAEHFEEYVRLAVDAARAAGVTFLVRLSALGANPNSPMRLSAQHGRADRLVMESGIPACVLMPSFFMDNLVNFHGMSIKAMHTWYGASGSGRVSAVSSADISEVAAAILADPNGHAGQRYVLTGPEAISDADLAGRLSQALGRTVAYADLAPDQLKAGAMAQGTPEWQADDLVALEKVKAAGWAAAVSPAVERILGRPAEVWDAFLERNRARLM